MHNVLEIYSTNNAEYLYMERPDMIKRTVLLKLFYKFNSIPIKNLQWCVCVFFLGTQQIRSKIKRRNIYDLKRSSKLPHTKTKSL